MKWPLAVLRVAAALVGVIAIIGIIGWMSGWFHPKISPGRLEAQAESLAGREVTQAESFEAEETVVAVGTVRPRRKTDVAAQILATILSVEVDPGDTVEAGRTLITLDDREIQTQMRTAEAGLTAAEADLAVQKREYDRYKSLVAENAVARADFEQIEGRHLVAETRVRQAREQIARADVVRAMRRSRLRVPEWWRTGTLIPGIWQRQANHFCRFTTRPSWNCTPAFGRVWQGS